MASLLKNQVLKHLSKFTKNLSPDKLQLSALKGSFEVNNIELNENVLMDLLELPVWMSLTKAYCNFASIKIQWMKLKTVPINIILDEVVIEGETCENFRNEANTGTGDKPNLNQDMGSYGFTNKVIDGITLTINSVSIQFSSNIFSASIELSRITVESRNCYWKKVDDLSKTRIRDQARGQVLLFKHIEWQTLRFVAKSETNNSVGQAPLRLIANQASCRITLKKRLSDCAMLGARIMVIFDDLLWVLTDSQLLSALHFADYLNGLIKRAPRTKTFEGNDTKNVSLQQQQAQAKAKLMSMNPNSPTKKPPTPLSNTISNLFGQFDFLETSFHLIVRRIEVHLMDDLGPQSERSHCPDLNEGGALQMTFLKLMIDLYPYQSVTGNRKHWFRYSEPSPNRQTFINHKLRTFYLKQQANLKNEGSKFNLQSLQYHLLSRVLVIRLSDYSIGCVSTNSGNRANRNNRTEVESIKLISVDNTVLIPGNLNPIYIELNNYFYVEPFDKLELPVPDTNIFASISPLRFNFEPLTILWINAFFANLRNALIKLQEAFPNNNSTQEKVNLRAEIVMPTIVLNLNSNNPACTEIQAESEYSSIELKISRILIYNCDSYIQPDYFRNLEGMLKYFSSNMEFYFEKKKYPWLSCDMKSISNEFVHQISRWFASKTAEENINSKFQIDFWTANIEPMWIEFKSTKLNRSDSFLEPINLTLWLYPASENDKSGIDMNIIAKINDPIKVQINHNQLLCLLRLLEKIGEFTSMLNYDTYMIQRSHYKRDIEQNCEEKDKLFSFDIDEKVVKAIFKSMAIVTTLPEVNVFLLLNEQEIESEELVNISEVECDNHVTMNELTPISSYSPLSNEPDQNGCDDAYIDSGEFINRADSSFENLSFTALPQGAIINGTCDQNMTKGHCPNDDISQPVKPTSNNNQTRRSMFSLNSSNSLDSNAKIHYNCAENDDTISTFSDMSADDSDQQSFIAMLAEGTENFDDIFYDNDLVEVAEVAEEISENFKLTNGDEDNTLNDTSPIRVNHSFVAAKPKTTYYEVLQIRIKDLNLVHQSSKGFLSQICIDTSSIKLNEHHHLTKANYLNLYKAGHLDPDEPLPDVPYNERLRLTLRIDSFNKGTLRDEMISVRVQNLSQSLNKKTIDLIVDFFQDNIADKPAPTAIMLENVKVKIIDDSVRMPPAEFTIPKLKLVRNKENKWVVDLETSLPKESPLYNQLLLQHLKIFERNLLFDIKDLINEQDRLNMVQKRLLTRTDSETQQILEQVLNQKELLLQEIELLRKENIELRTRLPK